jgi:site-specific recombinase XerD
MNKIITKDLIEKFKNHLINEEKASATLEKYMRDMKVFSEWTSGSELNKRVVLDYKEYLIGKFAPASVNSVLSSLNSFFDFNNWHEMKVRMLKIQKQIFSQKEKELSKAEYERLLDAAKAKSNERLYLLMQTICSSGIRVSELQYITVEAVKLKKSTINCKGKMRIVILPKELCRMLTEYAKTQNITSGSVFVTKSGKPLDRSTIWKMMKALCESAKVSKYKVFPHNLRHLFARTFYILVTICAITFYAHKHIARLYIARIICNSVHINTKCLITLYIQRADQL